MPTDTTRAKELAGLIAELREGCPLPGRASILEPLKRANRNMAEAASLIERLCRERDELRQTLGNIASRIETAVGGGTVDIERPPLGWPMTQSAAQSSLLLSILDTARALAGQPQ